MEFQEAKTLIMEFPFPLYQGANCAWSYSDEDSPVQIGVMTDFAVGENIKGEKMLMLHIKEVVDAI